MQGQVLPRERVCNAPSTAPTSPAAADLDVREWVRLPRLAEFIDPLTGHADHLADLVGG
jgi:hypothetical protein